MLRGKLSDIQRKPFIKVYPGYGHTGNLVVYGHVFARRPHVSRWKKNSFLGNLIRLVRLFLVKPVAYAPVQLRMGGQVIDGRCAYDGFFRFEWTSSIQLAAGWHGITVSCLSEQGVVLSSEEGRVWVPYVTQFAFISDIDDTIMKSYSATVFRRLYELLRRNPDRRRLFRETAAHYALLAQTHTGPDIPNPFFYVSSSEWNLYDYLVRIFRHNELPEGIFLLNQLKRWYEFFKTGKTAHSGKLIRISRVLQAFPLQQFVLLGDNSQEDPQLYKAIAEKHPEKIFAVYIRNVRPERSAATAALLAELAKANVHVCLFGSSAEAVMHGRKTGLLPEAIGL